MIALEGGRAGPPSLALSLSSLLSSPLSSPLSPLGCSRCCSRPGPRCRRRPRHPRSSLCSRPQHDPASEHPTDPTSRRTLPVDVVAGGGSVRILILVDGIRKHRCKWRLIGASLPRRTDSSTRNRWNRLVKERDDARQLADLVEAGCTSVGGGESGDAEALPPLRATCASLSSAEGEQPPAAQRDAELCPPVPVSVQACACPPMCVRSAAMRVSLCVHVACARVACGCARMRLLSRVRMVAWPAT